MAIFPARIDADGKVITSDRSINLSKTNNDEVQWVSEGDSGPWTVVFPDPTPGPPEYYGSPFGSNRFVVPQTGNVRSGDAVVPPTKTPYKYEVRDSSGALKDDPDILIDD